MSKSTTTKKSIRALGGSKVTPRPRATASRDQATSRRPSVFPAHLSSTPQEWRNLKRTEWKEVMQAISRYQHGCAYAPAGNALYHLGKLAQQIDEALEGDWIVW